MAASTESTFGLSSKSPWCSYTYYKVGNNSIKRDKPYERNRNAHSWRFGLKILIRSLRNSYISHAVLRNEKKHLEDKRYSHKRDKEGRLNVNWMCNYIVFIACGYRFMNDSLENICFRWLPCSVDFSTVSFLCIRKESQHRSLQKRGALDRSSWKITTFRNFVNN